MRKIWVAVIGIMVLSTLGNLIGGTDTPSQASVNPGAVSAPARANVPAAPRFDATMYVSASSLNMREAPSTSARVLTSLPRNAPVLAGERQNGWVLVSANGLIGWVSGDYLAGAPAVVVQAPPARSVPAPSAPGYSLVQQNQQAASCPGRLYCSQIGSCQEARYYLANCSWGYRLDADNDGVPCETICR